MPVIEKIDYTDEIADSLLTILETYLPARLLQVEEAKRPIAVSATGWKQGSVSLVARSETGPFVTVSSDPPGGATLKFLGTGVPSGVVPTVHGTYTLFASYAMDAKFSERAVAQSRQAAACIAVVLAKYAVRDVTEANLGWKAGLVEHISSGDGTVEHATGKPLTYIFGCVRWSCILDAGPARET